MNYDDAVGTILKHYPAKGLEWAESQLKRIVDNLDEGPVPYEEILVTQFLIDLDAQN